MSNLNAFFSDLATAHIYKVTPTPVTVESWSGTLVPKSVSRSPSCPGSTTLNFFPWLPFRLDPNNSNRPDGQGNNNAYICSPANPVFWGWSPLFNLTSQVVSSAHTAGLTIEEFDLQNEVNLYDFAVEARLVYDNQPTTPVPTSVPVFTNLQNRLAVYYSAGAVVVSVSGRSPQDGSSLGLDCGSIYGDSAMLLNLSELLAAVSGYKFGNTAGTISIWDGTMSCYNTNSGCGTPQTNPNWTQCVTQGMVSAPAPQAVPGVLDIHSTPSCILNAAGSDCDRTNATLATSQATTFFSDYWSLMSYRGLTAATAMFGELPNNQPGDCEGQYPVDAQWTAAGYPPSRLYSNAATHTVLRPWENSVQPCYQIPANIGAPSGPYAR